MRLKKLIFAGLVVGMAGSGMWAMEEKEGSNDSSAITNAKKAVLQMKNDNNVVLHDTLRTTYGLLSVGCGLGALYGAYKTMKSGVAKNMLWTGLFLGGTALCGWLAKRENDKYHAGMAPNEKAKNLVKIALQKKNCSAEIGALQDMLKIRPFFSPFKRRDERWDINLQEPQQQKDSNKDQQQKDQSKDPRKEIEDEINSWVQTDYTQLYGPRGSEDLYLKRFFSQSYFDDKSISLGTKIDNSGLDADAKTDLLKRRNDVIYRLKDKCKVCFEKSAQLNEVYEQGKADFKKKIQEYYETQQKLNNNIAFDEPGFESKRTDYNNNYKKNDIDQQVKTFKEGFKRVYKSDLLLQDEKSLREVLEETSDYPWDVLRVRFIISCRSFDETIQGFIKKGCTDYFCNRVDGLAKNCIFRTQNDFNTKKNEWLKLVTADFDEKLQALRKENEALIAPKALEEKVEKAKTQFKKELNDYAEKLSGNDKRDVTFM